MILSGIAKISLLLGLLASILASQLVNLNQLKASSVKSSTNEIERQHEIMTLRLQLLSHVPDFGFPNLISNWVFLNFLQYFGNSAIRDIKGYGLSPNFFKVIIDRDPRFLDSYIYLTNSISIYVGNPHESIRLMEHGLAQMSPETIPKSYLVWRYKATDELLFVGDTQVAKKSYETAVDWAERSSDPNADFIAKLSRQTAIFLATDPNSKPAQINSWSQVLLRATDDTIRQKAITQIEALGGTVLVSENGQVTVRYNTNDQ